MLFRSIAITSILGYLLKKRKIVRSMKEMINKNNFNVGIVLLIIFISFILLFSYLICTDYIQRISKADKETTIIVNSFRISIFMPKMLRIMVYPWIHKITTFYYLKDNNEIWYLLKPINGSEFLVGDHFLENECQKLKFVNFDDIKKKEIFFNTVKDGLQSDDVRNSEFSSKDNSSVAK